ncbi:protein arginine N-methyltransferase 1 [Anoplophora glabripennis]|uniref:protein arginine N-methyltransferase 1 n=1 Tax=Anoplophora glabripennis TaxID=217634 RepID=UPI000873DC92|nr:protein arginine N-methyltransferase 1 [Anoplophora glabripennis]
MTDEEECPTLTDLTCGVNEDDDSDGWDEMEVSGEQTTCLFCPLQFHTIAVALDHCRSEHNFDLLALKNKYNMDCYSYIKMINYIRLQKPDPKILTESSIALWDDDVYLKPGEMETWLMYDFDDLGSAPSTPHYAIDGKTPISNINFSDLQRQIQELNMQVRHKDMLLENYLKDMEKMKEVTRTIVDSGDNGTRKIQSNFNSTGCDSSDYFNSYSHFGIHHEMLNDKVRTESYRDAILNNMQLFSGKIVLDVGCGTGILSMFSAKAGAQKVIGIDQSEVVYKAMDIIRENNLQETIHLIKGQVEKTTLPVEKVDIIVSEWMGYFLLFEGMLDSFIYARDTYLKTDGVVLPNRCNISLAGICDLERYSKVIDFWDDVYGFSMKCMKAEALKEAFVETVPPEKVLTDSAVVTDINLRTCNVNACIFSSKFKLTANKDGTLTAVAGYFDTFFDLENSVEFSTGPHSTKTHWQQTVFFLGETVNVRRGEVIEGTISCTRLTKNVRGLSVAITIRKNKYQYYLD